MYWLVTCLVRSPIGPDIEKITGTGLQIYANLVVTTHHYYEKYDNFIEIHVELQIYANWS